MHSRSTKRVARRRILPGGCHADLGGRVIASGVAMAQLEAGRPEWQGAVEGAGGGGVAREEEKMHSRKCMQENACIQDVDSA